MTCLIPIYHNKKSDKRLYIYNELVDMHNVGNIFDREQTNAI